MLSSLLEGAQDALEVILYVVEQVVTLAAMFLGVLLTIPCSLQSWHDVPSTLEAGRTIDAWDWAPLNWVYGNPEDGVSGRYAKVWDGPNHVPYMAGRNPVWRAMCWSIGRNSADELKYVFRWRWSLPAPLIKKPYWNREFKAGWQLENGVSVPVFSL